MRYLILLLLPIVCAGEITSSTITSNSLQAHGQRYCRDRHVDSLGRVHEASFKVPGNANLRDILAQRATALLSRLEAAEAERVVGLVMDGKPLPATLEFTTWAVVRQVATARRAELETEITTLSTQRTRIDDSAEINP